MISRNDFIQEWITALRSGEYTQTQGCLNDGTGFCCLGVACEIGIKYGLVVKEIVETVNNKGITYDGLDTMLPSRLSNFMETNSDYSSNLANMNDHGDTFSQIACRIERDIAYDRFGNKNAVKKKHKCPDWDHMIGNSPSELTNY